ncbi:MAG: MFS transporter [Candidatus Limnocylindrales bacterium]|jgi:EmrB/QacA subfamily drug resistance transporter
MERKWLILTSVSLGSLMATLDGSIVNIALPAIQTDFRIDLTTVEWVVVAYLLVVGSLLLPVGRLGEVLTFKRVYLVGFAVFTVASVCCGASPTAEALVSFRVVQAIGAAMIMAMGPAIVARTFPAHERGRALGLNGVSVSIGLSLGPALGGLLTQAATWRAIFLINAPIGVIAILWAARILPQEEPGRGQSFDVEGAVLSGAALFALLLALSDGQQWGWTSPAILGLLVAFVGLGAAFVFVERRSLQPMIDLALFRIRPFTAGLASVVVAFLGLFTATFLLPFLLQQARGFSPVEAGLLLTPLPIAMAVVAPFSGAASDRFGPRVLASAGMAIMVLGLLSLTQLSVNFALPDLIWRLVLLGIGQGLFMSPNSSAVLGSVPRPRVGTASGTLAQMRVNGQALGIALSAAIVATRLPVHLAELGHGAPTTAIRNEALAGAIHDAFAVAAIICCIGIVASLVRGSHRPGQTVPAVGAAESATSAARPSSARS